MNVTRRVLPTTVVTELAFVTTAGAPPAANSIITFVSEGRMVPVGNPEPVMVMLVIPACPAAGVAAGVRVTVDCERKVRGPARKAMKAAGNAKRQTSMERISGMRFPSVDSDEDRQGSAQRITPFGSGTSDTVTTAKSAPGDRDGPDDGSICAVIVGDPTRNIVPSDRRKLVWLRVAEKMALLNMDVSENCTGSVGSSAPAPDRPTGSPRVYRRLSVSANC